MSFVTWLALPVVVTLIASVIMLFLGRSPRTDMHQDIESFARFRGALERQTSSQGHASSQGDVSEDQEGASGDRSDAARSGVSPPSGR